MNSLATETEAASIIGSLVMQFGYIDGCIVLVLSDGRNLRIGSDAPLWFVVDEYTLQ